MTSLLTLYSTSGIQTVQLPQPEQNEVTVAKVKTAISDDNVIELILSYAGDPTLPDMNDKIYQFILQAYDQNGLLSRFFIDLTEIPQGKHYEVLMDLVDRVATIAQAPRILPGVQTALRNPGAILALGALYPIIDAAAPAADRDLITVFRRIADKIPQARNFLDSPEISQLAPKEKAAQIRIWLQKKENRVLCGKVSELDLQSSGLTTVPIEIEAFYNLRQLYLNHNRISIMPNLHLPKLRRLDLQHNQLTMIPNFSHLNLPSLYLLDLGSNLLKEVPDFNELLSLEYLYLFNNQLATVPYFNELPRLRHIGFEDGNPLTALPKDYRKQMQARGIW